MAKEKKIFYVTIHSVHCTDIGEQHNGANFKFLKYKFIFKIFTLMLEFNHCHSPIIVNMFHLTLDDIAVI